MNTVHVIAAILMALSAPAVFAGETVVPPLVAAIVGGETVVSPLIEGAAPSPPVEQGEEDDTRPMRELCASYADEEGVIGAEREAHIDECISSMTDLSDSMQAKFETAGIEPEAMPATTKTTDANASNTTNVANTTGATGVHPESMAKTSAVGKSKAATPPEELVADELVDKPAPGVEELIPKLTVKTK